MVVVVVGKSPVGVVESVESEMIRKGGSFDARNCSRIFVSIIAAVDNNGPISS